MSKEIHNPLGHRKECLGPIGSFEVRDRRTTCKICQRVRTLDWIISCMCCCKAACYPDCSDPDDGTVCVNCKDHEEPYECMKKE